MVFVWLWWLRIISTLLLLGRNEWFVLLSTYENSAHTFYLWKWYTCFLLMKMIHTLSTKENDAHYLWKKALLYFQLIDIVYIRQCWYWNSIDLFLKNSSWINTSVIFEKGYFQNNCRRNAEQVRSMVRVRIFLARFAT